MGKCCEIYQNGLEVKDYTSEETKKIFPIGTQVICQLFSGKYKINYISNVIGYEYDIDGFVTRILINEKDEYGFITKRKFHISKVTLTEYQIRKNELNKILND